MTIRKGTMAIRVETNVDVDKLPRRTAHAVHALLYASYEAGMPVSAAEICVYDSEAISVRATGAALREARRLGLAEYYPPYWVASYIAGNHRKDFEERYLNDTEEGEDR